MQARSIRFSIIILTYARDEVLVGVIDRLRSFLHARSDYELILVDNNPIAGNRADLLAGFAHVTYLHDGMNKGVVGRNDGIDAAVGEFVILFDDDVFMETPGFLDDFARDFDREPELGCVTIRKHVRGETRRRVDLIPHTRKDVDLTRPFLTFRFVGGCVAFRTSTLRKVGAFLPDFFYGLEEIELSYRIIDDGWKILYQPAIVVEELEHPGGRKPKKDVQTDRLMNKYIMSWLHIPFPQIFFNYLLFTPYIMYRAGGEIRVGKAISGFVAWLRRRDRVRRKPLSRKAQAYIRACGGAVWR